MYTLLRIGHSSIRFLLLALLVTVIVRSFMGWKNKRDYTKTDDNFSLLLFIITHVQLLLGILLFMLSPLVIFSGESMKQSALRYWLVEHGIGMIAATILITVARLSSKKLTHSMEKNKRMFILNALALVIVIIIVIQSQRGFFTITW